MGINDIKVISTVIDLCQQCINKLNHFKQKTKFDHILKLQCKVAKLYSFINSEDSDCTYKAALQKYSGVNKKDIDLFVEKQIEYGDFKFNNQNYDEAIEIYTNTLSNVANNNIVTSNLYYKIVHSYIEIIYLKQQNKTDYTKELDKAIEFTVKEYEIKKELYKDDFVGYHLNLTTEHMIKLQKLRKELEQQHNDTTDIAIEKRVTFSEVGQICEFDNILPPNDVMVEITGANIE